MTGLLGRAEPLLLELGDGAIGLHLGKRVVDGLGQRDIVGVYDDAVLLARGNDLENGAVIVLVRDVVGGSGLVIDDGLDLAGAQRREHVGGLLERRVGGVLQVLLGPILTRGTGLSADGLPVERIAARDIGILEDDDGEIGIIVRIGEGDLLGALVADGNGADGAIEGLAAGDLRHERIEGLILDVGVEAEVLRDLLDERDVIALDLAILLVLHRSVIGTRGDRQGAGGDELVLAISRRAGARRARLRGPAATCAQRQHGDDGHARKAEHENLGYFSLEHLSPLLLETANMTR